MRAASRLTPRPAGHVLLMLPLALLLACEAPDGTEEMVPEWATTTYAPQNRPDVRGTTGAVASDHPLATQVGMAVLQDGGTATDAVIAMAGVLAVTRPHMNGIGGDAFGMGRIAPCADNLSGTRRRPQCGAGVGRPGGRCVH